MSSHHQAPLKRWSPLVIASIAVVVGALSGLAVTGIQSFTATAHEFPVSSTPAKGAALTALPPKFEVTMNENMLDLAGAGNGFALQIVGADGLFYGDGCLTISGAVMSTPAVLGAPGAYTMRWQVVSADGHTVADEYPFMWAPTTPVTSSPGSTSPPVCGAALDSPPNASPPATGAQTPPPAPTSPDSTAQDNASRDTRANLPLWIGGTVLGLAAIIVAALIVTERRRGVRK